jgi:hypothetical protein
MNMLLIYEDLNINSKLGIFIISIIIIISMTYLWALKFVLKLLESTSVLLTVIHTLPSITEEEKPYFLASKYYYLI